MTNKETSSNETPHLRSSYRAFLTVAVTLEIGNEIIRCVECQNISTSGMLLISNQDIAKGTCGTVTLTKKCGIRRYSFSADFEVVRKYKKGDYHKIGINYIQIFDDDLKCLEKIVNYYLSLAVRKNFNVHDKKIDSIIFKIAQTKDELKQAYSIVHDTYVQENYIDSLQNGMKISIYNSLPLATTLIGKLANEVIITCSIFPDSKIGLPIDYAFKSELSKYRANKRYIGEAGAFAIKKGMKNINKNLILFLHKLLVNYSTDYLKLNDLFMAINPSHILYYKYMWCCDIISDVRQYGTVKNNPAVLLHYDTILGKQRIKEECDEMPAKNNIYEFLEKEIECIELPKTDKPLSVWNNNLLHYFFEEKSDVFLHADKSLVKSIYDFYN